LMIVKLSRWTKIDYLSIVSRRCTLVAILLRSIATGELGRLIVFIGESR